MRHVYRMIEAELFTYHGGWAVDTQFMDLMGSAYLLADGRGTPVENATTTILIPKSGRYRIWARTKDWLPQYHPGRFRLIVNGSQSQHILGEQGKNGWLWEDAGVFELASDVTLELQDLTGYYGRCDALLLTDDLEFVPPSSREEIDVLRVRFGAVSHAEIEMPDCDVLVIGGGLAGATAAVAAARNGARVLLLHDRPMLGGNASPELLIPPVGAWNGRKEGPFEPRETGLVEEYRTAGNQVVTEGKLYTDRLHRLVQGEPNLTLYLNTHVLNAESVAGESSTGRGSAREYRIIAVHALEIPTGTRMCFRPGLVIDCSGDSVPAITAGAEYRHGKEPKSEFDEPWAPENPSTDTMGNGIKYYPLDTGRPEVFTAPPWAYRFPSCESFMPGRHPDPVAAGVGRDGRGIGRQWKNELGGTMDTFADAEEIRDELFRLVFGIWDHIKNRCDEKREPAATYRLGWVGYVAGKRENRRLVGDYILTQNDIIRKTVFPDAVAYGAWVNDDHYSEGFFHNGSFGTHMINRTEACFGEEYAIPFRSLYSRNVSNLLMAGRNISATHLALSNTRVMITCALLGHAAGTAAALCVRYGVSPRELYQGRLPELQQQLLKEGMFIPGVRAEDPRDLALRATISSSSERRLAGGEKMAARNVVNGISRATAAGSSAWAPEIAGESPGAAAIHWIELAWEEPVRLNVVHIQFQTASLSPASFSILVEEDGDWQLAAEVTGNTHRRHVLGIGQTETNRLRVIESEPAGIAEIRVYLEERESLLSARRAHRRMRQPDHGPFLPWEEGFEEKYYAK